jgi:hypothetical protein
VNEGRKLLYPLAFPIFCWHVPIKKKMIFSLLIVWRQNQTRHLTGKSLSVTSQHMAKQQKPYLYPVFGLVIKGRKIICIEQRPLDMPHGQFDLCRSQEFFFRVIRQNSRNEKKIDKWKPL